MVLGRIWDFSQFHDDTALTDDAGFSVSYAELLALQEKISRLIEDRPLVMLFAQNTVGAISGYAAFLNSGFPIMVVSSDISKDLRHDLLSAYRPAVLLLSDEQKTEYPFMKEIVRIYDYVALFTNYDAPLSVNEKLGLLLSTSGTTGSSKFVRLSFDNVLCNAKNMGNYLDMTSKERTITALPMQYTYGLSVINVSLLKGATMIVTKKSFLEEEFWDLFEEQKVTAFHAVASTYDAIRQIGLLEEDFDSLRLLTQAGSRLPVDLHDYLTKYAAENGKSFIAMYGQSEATAAISYLPSDKSLEKEGSVGIPVDGGRITLIDEDGKPVEEPEKEGEICYEGANVAMGYATCPEDLIKGDEWNGKIRTGDIGKRDRDGFYYITGRLKRYIKMYGHRISLDEIDDNIMEALHIKSASTGEDDHLAIFVTGEAQKQAVTQFVIKNFSGIRTGVKVAIVKELPKNKSGKIRYGELADIAKGLDW